MNINTEKITSSSFLITGGAGFIGSNLVEYLLKYNPKKVVVLDNLSTGFIKNIKAFESYSNFQFLEGDIRNIRDCMSAASGIDFISHQAALGSVPRSIENPALTNDVNISGFLNMLLAAKECKVKRFVYAASSSTYGDSLVLPKVESVIGKPLSPYAITKYVNELYAQVFASTYGIETIGLRYFNVFGPKQDPNGAYAAVIPLFIQAAIDHIAPKINGDGEQTRDFTFVSNAVEANVLAMLTDNQDAVNQVYNVALGERTSVNQLYRFICQEVHSNEVLQLPVYGKVRNGDIRDSLADISKAKKLIGYNPSINVKEGLKLTIQWFVENQLFIKNNQ